MTGYLLDTNVLSELSRDVPNPDVVAFLSDADDLWLSSVVIHEIEYGLELLPAGRRRDLLCEIQSSVLLAYVNRILPFDRSVAEWAARMRAAARRAGRVVDLGDVLIAGTAKVHDLTVATRNVRDYEGMGVDVFDPWNFR